MGLYPGPRVSTSRLCPHVLTVRSGYGATPDCSCASPRVLCYSHVHAPTEAERERSSLAHVESAPATMTATVTMPDWLEPMAATLTQERFAGGDWLFERKFDGIRLLAYKRGARNETILNGQPGNVVRGMLA